MRVLLFAWLSCFAFACARRFRFSVRFLRVALGEARRHLHRPTALKLLAPRLGSSAWQVPLGARGTPCAPGGHAGRAATAARTADVGEARARRERPDRTAGRTARLRARVLACSARLHALRVCAPRVLACSARVHASRVCAFRVLACSARLHAPRVCALARLRTRRAPARLTRASCGVHPTPSGATCRVRGTRPASSNHNPSPLSSAAGKVCDLVFS